MDNVTIEDIARALARSDDANELALLRQLARDARTEAGGAE